MTDQASRLRDKKVCIISPTAYPLLDASAGGTLTGGAEAQLFTIGRELARAGMDVHFLVDDHGQPQRVERNGMTAHRAAFRYMGGSKKYLLPDWLKIFWTLRRIRADFHLIKVPRHLLPLVGLYCRMHGSKLIFVGQKDSDLEEKVIRSQEGAPGWWLYLAGLKLVSAIVAQTKTQQAGFLRVFGKQSVVIRNVLTLADDDVGVKQDYVLWVGNSTNDKQPQLVPELARALPHIHFRMIMAMSPSRPDDSYIRAQLPELPNLEYLGTVPFNEIAEHFKRARLFISTSRCEGFPNTFLQAWQYQTPVVSLLVDPDNVINRHNLGRVSGTLANMINDIDEINADPATLHALGSNARRYAYEQHSLDTAISSYCKLFESLLYV